jgi:Flp pilus assembly protein TadG
MKIKHLFSSEGGQAMVEAAVSLALLLTMVIGVMEGGWLLYAYHYTAYTAREGARWATVRGSTCGTTAEAAAMQCPATDIIIQTFVEGIPSMGLDPKKLIVKVDRCTYVQGTACVCAAPLGDPWCNNPGDQVKVKVSYNFLLSVPFIPIPSMTVHSTAQMIMSQ